MNILISNDDGIRAEGIARLAAAALPFGRVYVAAPQSQCSGMSQKLTIRGTLAVEQADFPVPVEAAWAVGGTPADCVKAAVKALVPCRPDVVLTGVNQGWNAGLDIAYSGTIGAALDTAPYPDPDLIVRTSGEQRLSNFLLWQASYAEFWFPEVLWPDFTERDFDAAVEEYARRDRRFGLVK